MRAIPKAGLVFSIVIFCQLLFAQTETPIKGSFECNDIRRIIELADSLFGARNFDSAVVVSQIAYDSARSLLGESDSLYVRSLKRLAESHAHSDNYEKMVKYLNQWLDIVESDPNFDPSIIASVNFRAGKVCRFLCRFSEAEMHLKRTLKIYEDTSKFEPYAKANSFKELATIYLVQLRYAEAESLVRKSIELAIDADLDTTGNFAEITNLLGYICKEQGRYHEAESWFKQGLELREKRYGSESWGLSESLNNLGEVYEIWDRYPEAESLYLRALRFREKDLGYDHPFLYYHLANLGELYALQGLYAKADSFLNRALQIVVDTYGTRHSHVARCEKALGDLYRWQGEYIRAETFYNRALETNKKIFGFEHPDLTHCLNGLALLYGSTGQYSKSLKYKRELMECKLSLIENVFSYASEEQKMRYADQFSLLDGSFFSMALINASEDSKRLALEMTLKGKALVIDALSEEREIAYCSDDQNIENTEGQLEEVSRHFCQMHLSTMRSQKVPQEYRDSLQVLRVRKDSLQTQLSRLCSPFRDELIARRFEVADVARVLPESGVLWEFVEYQPYDFGEIGSDEQRKGAPRYLAFTLNHSGAVTLTDLGDAREIDSLVNLTQRRIYEDRPWVYSPLVAEANRHLDEITGRLYDIIFAPLESQLDHRVDIYICPDGQLNLLPFEIFRCPDGMYVIEKYSISYLSSGRDLLRFEKERPPSDWALLVADPDFEFSAGSSDQQRDRTPKQLAIAPIRHEPYRGVSGCLSNRFNSLPYSREEASSIAETLKGRGKLDVDVYCDSNAAEELLKEMPAVPRVLHLATHGYFCEDLSLAGNQILENPLLRSGLALAGANRLMDANHRSDSRREDGILTAFEASGLDLVGTELVTLSACETGMGEVKNGEGVYGLRRAFQHAGTRSIVMSLWKVPDKETCELMDGFYQNWLAGQSKKEAFRQAILSLLHLYRDRYGVAHPYLWGGFVLFGDPN